MRFAWLIALLAAAPLIGQNGPPTWKQRVQVHRQRLATADKTVLLAALSSRDHAEAFAALSFENDGKIRYPEKALVKLLDSTRVRALARAASLLLGRRKSPTALEALIRHVDRRGPGDDTALEAWMQSSSLQGKPVLMRRASRAKGTDVTSLLAVRALALYPGDDVIVLLVQLQSDWSEDVQKAATEALALRKKAGMKTQVQFKPAPVGKRPEEIAYRVGSNDDPSVRTKKRAAASEQATQQSEATARVEKKNAERTAAINKARLERGLPAFR